MRKAVLAGIAGAILASSTSRGQIAPTVPHLQQKSSCSDFRRNPDGSWVALRPTSVSGIQVSPGLVLIVNQFHSGMDLATRLNRTCK